eukprot:1215200-Prorocentrum_lima.AAC.1
MHSSSRTPMGHMRCADSWERCSYRPGLPHPRGWEDIGDANDNHGNHSGAAHPQATDITHDS